MTGDERTMLTAWLDYQRADAAVEVRGARWCGAGAPGVPPSSLTLLGLVRHMALVEWWWFDHVFAGSPSPEPIPTQQDRDADFNDLDPARAMADIELFQRQCDVSRAIADAASLDTLAASTEKSPLSLRWIMVHMIEEYARHNGHADLLARADRRRRGGVSAGDVGTGDARRGSPGVKFSIRQILASAAGAVIAAVIASSFGVKGTIVGVAIGSAAATIATAFVAQSIERGHEAVKQVVVRAPDSSALLRKLGGTGTSGARRPVDATGPRRCRGPVGRAPSADGRRRPTAGDLGRRPTPRPRERIDATTLPMRPAGSPDRAGGAADVQLEDHCGHGGHRVRARAAVHHGHRADLGQAAVRDLREHRRRDDGQEHLHAAALAGPDHDDHDPDDDSDVVDDLIHDDGDQHDDQHDGAGEHHHDGRARCLDHHDRPRRVGRIDDDIAVGRAIALRSRVTSP